jgi:hypothetical protein
VPKRKRRSQGLIAATALSSFDAEDPDLLVVVIETPKGSRNKYAFDPAERIFSLTKVLPAGMEFPYDFGFIPSTLAEDGDPLDALVLMDEPAFPRCRLTCRPIGVIEGVQEGKKSTERNDRVSTGSLASRGPARREGASRPVARPRAIEVVSVDNGMEPDGGRSGSTGTGGTDSWRVNTARLAGARSSERCTR